MTREVARGGAAKSTRGMVVAGIMSGTSADGIDVALVRIRPYNRDAAGQPGRIQLLSHVAVPYPRAVRCRVLEAMNGEHESVAELSRLHWRLGQLYADAVENALEKHPMRLDLIGCHGQTMYHQASARNTLGGRVACTWQMGEASVLAARLGVPVVSDFRPADVAVGGQGAPLVPLLDYVLFRHAKRNRVLQNLGGIGNLTVVRANAAADDVFAFDTGPANMVVDAIMMECFRKPYDAGGTVAARGKVLEPVLRHFLANPFFRKAPPKSTGREQFGREFAAEFLARCRSLQARDKDAVATATAFTARTIGIAWKRLVQPALADAPTDFIVAGGGAENGTIMEMLRQEIAQGGNVAVRRSDDLGLPAAAKEATAFALLACQTWHGLPGNMPRVTGAERPVILGKISYA